MANRNFGVNVPLPYDKDELNTNPALRFLVDKVVGVPVEAYKAQKRGVQEFLTAKETAKRAEDTGRLNQVKRAEQGEAVKAVLA